VILVPDLVDVLKSADSDGERSVARVLHAVDGPADAVAFHSVKLRSHAYKQQAEADFVILWNGVVVVVEVKGGGVRKHDGVWYSVDRHDDWRRLSGSPMEQARSAMYALRDIVQEEGVGWFAHEAIVITPNIESPPSSVEWKPTHWLAEEAMTAPALASSLDAVVAGSRTPPARQRVARTDDLRTRLFGEFSRMPAVDVHRGAVLDEQNRATEGQARVLASLARNRRMMVVGGAGTGKSLLLAEAAKQEAGAGRSVLITNGSTAIVDFFKARVAHRNIEILPFDELRRKKAYDVVLVDEAQDLMTAEGMDRLDGVMAGGRTGGRWRMFLDPNNQAHVDGHFDREVYELVCEEASSFDLDRNVRNTKAIVHVVQEYLRADVGDPGVVYGEKVSWHRSPARAGVDEAVELALALAAVGVRRSDVWIISTTSDLPPTSDPRGVTVTSPRYAKGLEAEHVIVCDLPEDFDSAGVAAFYVAVTRPRVSLHILVSDADRKRLQRLIRQGVAS
jgi:hypothetical protein